MPQLLIELFSEEIPARMQLGAARDFERLMGDKLKGAGLTWDSLKAYVGPRRLCLVVEGLPAEQAAVTEEVKGPKNGAPEQAMAGFLRKVGLSQDQLTLENGVWMARIHKPGRNTAEVLGGLLRDVILSFPWPKSMRSGTSSFRWVRPLKRILFLFDGAVVPFELEGLQASNVTEGHRFLGSGESFAVTDFLNYEKLLADNFVILDHHVRQTVILDAARKVCADAGCELIEDQGLLEEVAGLNEWPVPLLGDMDPRFLTLPPEVIKTSMRTHQKYFAVREAKGPSIGSADTSPASPSARKGGEMAAKFLIVANMEAEDGGAEIKRGNAKVLSARLSDGVFFWTEDNKAGNPGRAASNFESWLERLKGTTFHIQLGTMYQRVMRITAMAEYIGRRVGAPANPVWQAARYAKADLASKMVGEFPELQGVMGGYYAPLAGLSTEVAEGIKEHYKPQGPSDSVPSSKIGAVVALADKIDTLVSFFAINEKPTGSKDPYALRRSALGILRILREHGMRLPLSELIDFWFDWITENRAEQSFVLTNAAFEKGDWSDVVDFFADRLKVQLREEGRPLEALEAVLSLGDDDIVRMTDKIAALVEAVQSPFGDDLLSVHKRASNILAASKMAFGDEEPRLLADAPEVEKNLVTHLRNTKIAVGNAVNSENWFEALRFIAALRHDVDAFLDGVLVNAEDPDTRANRLLILSGVCRLSLGVADLSKIA